MGDQLIAIQTKGYERLSYKELRNNITITSSWSQSQVMVQWSTKEFYK